VVVAVELIVLMAVVALEDLELMSLAQLQVVAVQQKRY